MTFWFLINASFAVVNAYFALHGTMPILSLVAGMLNTFVAGRIWGVAEIGRRFG